jgi:hypothetical protein
VFVVLTLMMSLWRLSRDIVIYSSSNHDPNPASQPEPASQRQQVTQFKRVVCPSFVSAFVTERFLAGRVEYSTIDIELRFVRTAPTVL